MSADAAFVASSGDLVLISALGSIQTRVMSIVFPMFSLIISPSMMPCT